ncbi:MAG TPA: energy transducer TonB [Thermoanaerobaculia bacterium]|nr:energy transducer TonB [Thermoanaerobaculia bacterium]
MTARTGFRLIFALGLIFALALVAAPARAQGEPQPGDAISQEDYRKACKEYIQASERSEGEALPRWKGLRLTQCYEEFGDFDKAVDAARKARSLASTPEERTHTTLDLGCALLAKVDAQANAEAANLFKEELASKMGAQARAGYFQALLELNRDGEAAEFLHSPGTKDKVETLDCKVVDPKQADALNERLHAIDPDLDVFPFGATAKRPELIRQVSPQMTDESRQHPGFSGTVVLEAIIDRQERVQCPRVLRGQPYGLSESAIAAVKQWRFKPATLNGRPVKVYYVLTVNFQVSRK